MSTADDIRAYWDADADSYDDAHHHRPTSAAEQAAWATALARLLPSSASRVLDCGAGTGFLSLIAARLGHKVTALDMSGGMLARLRVRAEEDGLAVEVAEGTAAEPPPGPFDVVMERHLLWTLPDPVRALQAWRGVAPFGRLVLIEGIWGHIDPLEAIRAQARDVLRRFRRQPGGHHASYDPQLRATLPWGTGTNPSAVVSAVAEAGWPDPWLERLRDVEWAAMLDAPLPERLLGVAPRFVVTAG